MLVVAGRAWPDWFLTQAWIEGVLVQLGEFLQQRFGPGLGRQDAAYRRQGEGPEANGTLQGRQHIGTLVMRHQGQQRGLSCVGGGWGWGVWGFGGRLGGRWPNCDCTRSLDTLRKN